METNHKILKTIRLVRQISIFNMDKTVHFLLSEITFLKVLSGILNKFIDQMVILFI